MTHVRDCLQDELGESKQNKTNDFLPALNWLLLIRHFYISHTPTTQPFSYATQGALESNIFVASSALKFISILASEVFVGSLMVQAIFSTPSQDQHFCFQTEFATLLDFLSTKCKVRRTFWLFCDTKVIPENNNTYTHHLASYNYIPTNTSPPITDLILTNRFHRAAAARIPPWIPMRKRCGPCALPTGDLLWDQR